MNYLVILSDQPQNCEAIIAHRFVVENSPDYAKVKAVREYIKENAIRHEEQVTVVKTFFIDGSAHLVD